MVHKGLHELPLDELDVCFVENVGNLKLSFTAVMRLSSKFSFSGEA